MRITLDTNILVRGHLNALGPCRALLSMIIDSDHILVLSQNLLYELEEVMLYPRVRKVTGLSEAQVTEYLGYLAGAAEFVDVGPAPFFHAGCRRLDGVAHSHPRRCGYFVLAGRTSQAA